MVVSLWTTEQVSPQNTRLRFKNMFNLTLFIVFLAWIEKHYLQIKEYKWHSYFHVYENIGSVTFTLVNSMDSSMPLPAYCLSKSNKMLSIHFYDVLHFLSGEALLLCHCLMMFVFFWVSEIRRWFVHWFEYISSFWEGFCSLELWEDWKSCVFAHKAKKEVGSWRQAFKETYSLSYRYFFFTTTFINLNLSSSGHLSYVIGIHTQFL